MTPYEALGGDAGLHRILDDFVHRMAGDFIIGWLFAGKDLERLVRMEVAFAAAHLGGPRAYGGRPLPEAHRGLPINDGMFRRRLALLRRVLADHGASDAVIETWIAHDTRLQGMITDGSDCAPPES